MSMVNMEREGVRLRKPVIFLYYIKSLIIIM